MSIQLNNEDFNKTGFVGILPPNTATTVALSRLGDFHSAPIADISVYNSSQLNERIITVASNKLYQGYNIFHTQLKKINWVLNNDGKIYAELPGIDKDCRILSESPAASGTIIAVHGNIFVVTETVGINLFIERIRKMGYDKEIHIGKPLTTAHATTEPYNLNSSVTLTTAATLVIDTATSPHNDAMSPSRAAEAAMSPVSYVSSATPSPVVQPAVIHSPPPPTSPTPELLSSLFASRSYASPTDTPTEPCCSKCVIL